MYVNNLRVVGLSDYDNEEEKQTAKEDDMVAKLA